MTPCAKCGAPVGEGAVECPRCGVVLAKAAEAADRELLRKRASMNRPRPAELPPEAKPFPWGRVLIVAMIALFIFGGYRWMTTSRNDELSQLAHEVKNAPPPSPRAAERGERQMRRLLLRFVIGIGVVVAGYMSLRSRLSP